MLEILNTFEFWGVLRCCFSLSLNWTVPPCEMKLIFHIVTSMSRQKSGISIVDKLSVISTSNSSSVTVVQSCVPLISIMLQRPHCSTICDLSELEWKLFTHDCFSNQSANKKYTNIDFKVQFYPELSYP